MQWKNYNRISKAWATVHLHELCIIVADASLNEILLQLFEEEKELVFNIALLFLLIDK